MRYIYKQKITIYSNKKILIVTARKNLVVFFIYIVSMKYLRTYKDLIKHNDDSKKYKVGDYVLWSGQLLKSGKDQPIKIIRELHFDGSGSYEHLYADGYTGVSEYKYIKRYLTPKEIEDFEIKINSTKYNL